MSKKIILTSVVVLLVGFGLYWLFKPTQVLTKKSDTELKEEKPKQINALTMKSVKPKIAKKLTEKQNVEKSEKESVAEEWYDNLPPKDRETAKKIQDALDNEDFEGVKAMVDAALKSDSSEVRQHAVDALGWFDQKAIADLTKFLSDKDSDVAQSAFNHWDSAVDMVEDDGFKIAVATEAMKTLRDSDMLENVSSKLKGAEDEKAAVRAVLDILRNVKGDSPAATTAKEAYEFITGEEFRGDGAALLWIAKKSQQSDD